MLMRASRGHEVAVTAPAAASRGGALEAGPWMLTGVGKRYGDAWALQDVDLAIGAGEVVSVTGPSGAGKTTLGRLISGLEVPSAGAVCHDGRDVSDLPVQARRAAHMFESFALYPTRTVAENVASPLQAPANAGRYTAEERNRRVMEVLELAEIAALRDRLPSQLSGGQKQRVALCRALVQDPSVFILDEPIGHLDARLRHKMRGEIKRRQNKLRQGTLWLTPDGIEAMAVADRMIVLHEGRVQQTGTPDDIFGRPANVQVARLIGDPAMNVLSTRFGATDEASLLIGDAQPVAVSSAFMARFADKAVARRLQVGLRPAELVLRPAHAFSDDISARSTLAAVGATDRVAATVYAVEPLGKTTLVTVDVGGQRLKVKAPADAPWSIGDPLFVLFNATAALSFHAESGELQS